MRILLASFMAIGVAILSGCSMFSAGPNMAYLKTQPSAKLVVPAGVKAPTEQAYYPIANTRVSAHSGPVSLVPPGSLASKQLAAKPHKPT